MADIICEIKIKIDDYYPKIGRIPFDDINCIISDDNDKTIIPLKEIEKIYFIKKSKVFNSDLIYTIKIVDKTNNYIIGDSYFIIPYIKIYSIIRMQTIKYEQYIKLSMETYIKDKIFGFLSSVKNLFLKLSIEINLVDSPDHNIVIFNNINSIRNSNFKNRNCNNSSLYDLTRSFSNSSNLKIIEKKLNKISNQSSTKISRNCGINKSYDINKTIKKISHSSKAFKYKTFYKKSPDKIILIDYYNPKKENLMKVYNEQGMKRNENDLKKYKSNSYYKIHHKNISCESTKKPQNLKIIKKSNSIKSNKNNYNDNNIKPFKRINKSKSKNNTEIKKNCKRRIPHNYKKGKDKNKVYENQLKRPKIFKFEIFENNSMDLKNIIKDQNEIKDIFLNNIKNFKNKNMELKKILVKGANNFNDLQLKYLLCREKYYFESKKMLKMINQKNDKDFKYFIHVQINSKYNNLLFNQLLNIKKRELNLLNIFLNYKNQTKKDPKQILQEKLKQQKQMHALVNLFRDLIKIYGNLSHLYDGDNNKKILIKSLFLRYNIREKEWNNNTSLIDIYNKMNNDIKHKNHQQKIKSIKKLEFKSIKEEKEEENEEKEEEENKNDGDEHKNKNVKTDDDKIHEQINYDDNNKENKDIIEKKNNEEEKNSDTNMNMNKDLNNKNFIMNNIIIKSK